MARSKSLEGASRDARCIARGELCSPNALLAAMKKERWELKRV